MKKTLLLLTISLVCFGAYAQSLTPSVISSTGGFSTSPSGSLSYTVGEMTMVQTFSAGNTILTQGFQQPNDYVTGLLDVTRDNFGSFVVYPNPAVDNLWYGLVFPESGKINVSLFNDLGQKVADVLATSYTTGKMIEPLAVSNYAAGTYFLSVNFVSDKDGKTHTVSKQFQVVN